jgi:hypothetical protein
MWPNVKGWGKRSAAGPLNHNGRGAVSELSWDQVVLHDEAEAAGITIDG